MGKQLRKIRAKMPSDPLEAELLAMAGAAIGVDDNSLDDSDDSLPEDNYDAALDNHTANNHVDIRPQFSEDIENMMSGKNKFKFFKKFVIKMSKKLSKKS